MAYSSMFIVHSLLVLSRSPGLAFSVAAALGWLAAPWPSARWPPVRWPPAHWLPSPLLLLATGVYAPLALGAPASSVSRCGWCRRQPSGVV